MSDIEYRGIRPEEWPDALVLWEQVFNVGPWLFHSLHKGTEDRRWDHCKVAMIDGDIAAAVDVFMRERRWTDGSPKKVGCIGSVATHPMHRRAGHSGKLLEMTIQTMEEDGCDYSFLFTGTHHHYERYGWFRVPTRVRYGHWQDRPSNTVEPIEFVTADQAFALHPLYAETHQSQPLSVVRNETGWRFSQRERINRPNRRLFITEGAYAVACIVGSPEIREIGYRDETALDHLLGGLKGALPAGEVLLALPRQPVLDAAIEKWFKDIREENWDYAMARPIADRVSRAELLELFNDPRSYHSALDDF